MLIIFAQKISTQHYTQKKKKKEHKKQNIGDGDGDKNIRTLHAKPTTTIPEMEISCRRGPWEGDRGEAQRRRWRYRRRAVLENRIRLGLAVRASSEPEELARNHVEDLIAVSL